MNNHTKSKEAESTAKANHKKTTLQAIFKPFIWLTVFPLAVFAGDLNEAAAAGPCAHIAGKPAAPPAGSKLVHKNGTFILTYNFTSQGHDALFFELKQNLNSATELTAKVKGDGKGHTLFAVVKDKSGESFYFPGQAITFKGWKTIKIKFNYPKVNPGEKFASIWGGDGNQHPDFPLQGIVIGLNDTPDTAVDTGTIMIKDIRIK